MEISIVDEKEKKQTGKTQKGTEKRGRKEEIKQRRKKEKNRQGRKEDKKTEKIGREK